MMERAFRIIPLAFRAVTFLQRGSSESLLSNHEAFLKVGRTRVQQLSSAVQQVASSTEKSAEVLPTSIEAQLKSAQRSEEILSLVHANELNGNEASLALSALKNSNLFANLEEADLSSDNRFASLLGTIEHSLKSLTAESLVNSIVNIFKLRQEDSPTIRFLLEECRQRLRRMAVRQLGFLVCNHRLLSTSAGSASLSREALRVLELRWKEMNNPFLLKRLLKTSLRLSPSFAERLEDKTLELIDNFSFQDLVDISGCIASSRRHSLLALRAISYQVEEQRSQWNVSQLLRLLNNMRVSKFCNYLFCKDVAAFCKDQLAECTTRQISEMVRCFGLLRIPEPELFDAILDHLDRHVADFTLSELQAIAFGLSIVNKKPPTQLVKRLVFDFSSLSLPEQVEFCLALAVFNACPAEQVKTVFQSTSAVNEIMGSDKPWHISLQLKLLQLNAHAKLECQGYGGPFLRDDVARYPRVNEPTTSSLHRDVTGKLEAALGNEHFFVSNVTLDSGYVIDAEMVVDEDGVPFSSVDYNISSDGRDHSPLRKDLPEGHSRIALIVNGPVSYLYGTSEFNGRRRMMRRQLEALEYRLIEVSFEEWSSCKTDVRKVELLRELMNGLVKKA